MFSFQNKTAVITGGGSGIGRAISVLFAKQGATVHILELDSGNALATVTEIEKAGGKAISYTCNVASQYEVSNVFEKIGAIHILVNNAGIAQIGKADTTTEPDFDKVMTVNVKGAYNCLFAAIPQLRKAGGGVILNMASVAAPSRIARPVCLQHIQRRSNSYDNECSQRLYFREYSLQFCFTCTGAHPFCRQFFSKQLSWKKEEMFEKLSKNTTHWPYGATHRKIAALALYLCSDEASFITGCDYPIDGGFVKLNN